MKENKTRNDSVSKHNKIANNIAKMSKVGMMVQKELQEINKARSTSKNFGQTGPPKKLSKY